MSSDTRAVYAALAALSDRYASHGAPPTRPAAPDLARHELRVFSQNGEDGVIEEILRRIGTGGGGFVEFGVGSGVEGNCVFLASVLGWRGLFMEADPDLFARLDARYEGHPSVRTVRALVGPENVDALLARPRPVARAATCSRSTSTASTSGSGGRSRRRARGVVVIEYNAHLGPDAELVQPLEPARRLGRLGPLRRRRSRPCAASPRARATGWCTPTSPG